jgi:hypothetical protein
MKLNEIYDPDDAKKNGHVVLLFRRLADSTNAALPVADVDMMRVSAQSHIPRKEGFFPATPKGSSYTTIG